jgi:hypothetical protein
MTPQERIKALEDALIEEKLKLAQGMTPENKKKDAEA